MTKDSFSRRFEGAQIVPRLWRHEAQLSRWRYEGEYSFYNCRETVCPERPEEPVDANSFVWVNREGDVLGHVSYGPDGRIPTVEGYLYSEEALDIGLGLRPDLCGQGMGAAFTALCMDFARERYGAVRFRLSVAAFNERAIKAYKKAGFSVECEVTNQVFRNKFYIMTGPCAGA